MTLLERDERMREEGRKEERVKNRIRVKKSKAIIHIGILFSFFISKT